jgi:midasin (ATPase involved in ribosome maturation)
MERAAAKDLDRWIQGRDRKPLVLRGARQVGKTWLVRDLAARSNLNLVEINFERDPRLMRVFQGADPVAVISDLSIALGARDRFPAFVAFSRRDSNRG